MEIRWVGMERELDVFRIKVDSLLFLVDIKKVVFDVLEENKWFMGWDKEVDFLE